MKYKTLIALIAVSSTSIFANNIINSESSFKTSTYEQSKELGSILNSKYGAVEIENDTDSDLYFGRENMQNSSLFLGTFPSNVIHPGEKATFKYQVDTGAYAAIEAQAGFQCTVSFDASFGTNIWALIDGSIIHSHFSADGQCGASASALAEAGVGILPSVSSIYNLEFEKVFPNEITGLPDTYKVVGFVSSARESNTGIAVDSNVRTSAIPDSGAGTTVTTGITRKVIENNHVEPGIITNYATTKIVYSGHMKP